ncbi:MAG: glutamine amidotransferase [Rhizobiaceae bacterium]
MAYFPYIKRPGAPKILVILHQATSTPGRVGMELQNLGYELEPRRPPLGDQLPETMEGYAGAIIFGGPMSANDNDEYVSRETDWIGVPMKEDKPFLGICLGAQMLSRHLGGCVMPNEREFAEVGYYPISPTDAGREIIEEWPGMIYQWHREGFSLPSGCELLASSPEYENQAIRCGKHIYGLQFHTELTYMMLNRWTIKGAGRFSLYGAQNRAEQMAGRLLYDAPVLKWMKKFLYQWVGPAEFHALNRCPPGSIKEKA